MKELTTVHTTTDYSIFKILASNRKVAKNGRLSKSIAERGQLMPIIVDGDMNIIDGQHRFEELKEMGKPIDYVISKELKEIDIPHINSTQKPWGLRDYLEFHLAHNNPEYVKLQAALTETGMSLTQFNRFMLKTDNGRAFKQGVFQFDKEEFLRKWSQYQDFNVCVGFGSEAFARAVAGLFRAKKYNHEYMKVKLAKLAGNVHRASNSENYQLQLENIYNHGLSEKNRINFKTV